MPTLIERLKQVFAPRSQQAVSAIVEPITPVHRKVLMIVHDPPVESEGGRRLTELFNWHKPDHMAKGYIDDLRECSGGYLNYEIVDRIDSDEFPVKEDGFRYTGESYVAAWKGKNHHEPDRIDYPALIEAHQLEHRRRLEEFDEVWFFSFPFAGHYESTMVGPGAFWCNSPPVKGTERFPSRFVMMGFNYERDGGPMLENFGHRTESIMKQVYATRGKRRNMWDRFIQHEKTHPGQSNCGTVHYAPNSLKDYDWGNPTPVTSFCDDWLTYPTLPGTPKTMTTADWGNGDMRQHHLWWLSHLPKVPGETDGVSNNWWEYVVDPNRV
jgi:hypothetical protein